MQPTPTFRDPLAAVLPDDGASLPGGERISDAVHTAADGMDRAADYLRDQDVRAMLSDIRDTVTRHPGAALLTAVAVGFVIARSISRN